jgi:hypothetical protein
MPAYTTVGSNRIEEAKAFYDALMPVVGFAPMMEHGSGGRIYTGKGSMFGVVGPFDGKAATVGNGTMIGFSLDSREQVDTFHATIMELGGSDEGAPGLRGPEEVRTYMAYARDLDGNKLCAFHFG